MKYESDNRHNEKEKMSMKVAEVMTLGVKSCSPNDTLHAAAKIMWENDCGCVPVIDDRASKLVGILTDRDICMAAYTQGVTLHALRVDSAMASNVISCSPEDELAEAEELMRQNKVRRLPVLAENGKLAGILSLSDIGREAGREPDEVQRQVTDAEIARTLAAICEPRAHTNAHFAFGIEVGEMEFRPGPPPKRGHLHKPHDRVR
jgi:CBS domain-containing protein